MGNDFECELEDVSIVILGSMNPTIFHPMWFADNNLIRREEAHEAKIEIIHREATIFSTEWFSCQVLPERFYIDTENASMFSLLKDLVIGAFKVLEHTPVQALGLNSNLHFRAPSEEAWHKIGHSLAPKQAWSQIVDNPGMRSLLVEGTRSGSQANKLNIRVEPSTKVEPGVYFNINHHFVIPPRGDVNATAGNSKLFDIIEGEWEGMLAYRNEAPLKLLSEVSQADA